MVKNKTDNNQNTEHINLYRKYRPRKFKEVKGQDNIVTALTNSLINKKHGHAYLFSGPRGVGKTSVAKIFASALNCIHRNSDDPEPCENCIENVNNSLNIVEFDGASNNTVDDMRDLIEKASNAPFEGDYKIYIIDEMHMLSNHAFNSLLKILEEPPKHIVFILATTDPQKIPSTILSRLIRFNFKLMSQKVIVSQLKYIFDKEKITYENQVLEHIARLSTGGMRDALSIADHAISLGNRNIKLDELVHAFSIVSNDNLIAIINHIKEKNKKELIALLEDLHQAGIETEKLIYNLIDVLKDFVVYKATNRTGLLNVLLKEQLETFKIDFDEARTYVFELYSILKKLYYIENTFEYLEMKLLEISLGLPEKQEVSKSVDSLKKFINNTEQKNDIIQEKSTKITEKYKNTDIEKSINIQGSINFPEPPEMPEIPNVKIPNLLKESNSKKTKPLVDEEQKPTQSTTESKPKTKFVSRNKKSDINKYSLEDYTSLFLQRDKNLKTSDEAKFSSIEYIVYSDFTATDQAQFTENELHLVQQSLAKCKIVFSSEKFLLLTSDSERALSHVDEQVKKLCINLLIYKVFKEYRYIYLIDREFQQQLLDYIKDVANGKVPKPKKHEILKADFVIKFLEKEKKEMDEIFSNTMLLKKFQRRKDEH
ncbi:DNA-directed DNA polymerase [Mycoplasmopsis californica]|uniref:DNA polymerase III subunit gamma/tau n=1 Tax=Mycoplasmopsis equigenitalium TaxID=114883 RepID=A0ABY5J1S1_9BACT|nr:DNA polymerase III subunit gamma/tau [Mycoplasmopsis equigenitalium]UUD37199.1 DNA polymerase III subunit gamma/tau [Mycoplasmopsis equigenitalium]VEU69497.1 DNA-directed DNA polymerase [Mycoplasmopsis californica]